MDEARRVASNIAEFLPELLKDAWLHYAEVSQGDCSHYGDDWNHHVPRARLWHTGAFRSPVQLVRRKHQPLARFLRHANNPMTPRPRAKSGRVAGVGTAEVNRHHRRARSSRPRFEVSLIGSGPGNPTGTSRLAALALAIVEECDQISGLHSLTVRRSNKFRTDALILGSVVLGIRVWRCIYPRGQAMNLGWTRQPIDCPSSAK